MRRSWFTDMQRLGRRSGLGFRLVVRAARSSAELKAQKRMVTVEGKPEPLYPGSKLMMTPILNKRNGRVVVWLAKAQRGGVK